MFEDSVLVQELTGYRDDKGRLEAELLLDNGQKVTVVVESHDRAPHGVVAYHNDA